MADNQNGVLNLNERQREVLKGSIDRFGEFTEKTIEAFGIPNFQCSPIAEKFRKAGFQIPAKSEFEQAFVIWWTAGLVATYGEGWLKVALETIDSLDLIQQEAESRSASDRH